MGKGLTNLDKKTELGRHVAWSNDLQSKVTHSYGLLMGEIGKCALQQTPDVEAAEGCGCCRCGSTKAIKCSWHGGLHPSFY